MNEKQQTPENFRRFWRNLVLYWLSKNGFECARVDHTGIDLIARNPKTKELAGISVKSRTRKHGTETEGIYIDNDEFEKVQKACKAFGCIPYYALVADLEIQNKIWVFILSMKKILSLYEKGKNVLSWKMTPKLIESYKNDKDIKMIVFSYTTLQWW
ncbi:hypothetical protein GX441_02775 [bacterium]|nr:hypothetical protein [bacterium]